MATTLEMKGDWTVAPFAAERGDLTNGVPSDLAFEVATVPGCVQYDLFKAGKLANPFASTQSALDAAWVSESDWIYKQSFEWSPGSSVLRWVVEVDGIDTYADLWLNGVLIGSTNDAYRTWRFPVDTALLRAGSNELVIHVKAHTRMVADMVDEARNRLHYTDGLVGRLGKALIRRYQRSFFSGSSLLNIGTGILGIGIFRPIRLVGLPSVHVADVFVTTESASARQAQLGVAITLDSHESVKTIDLSIELLNPADSDAVAAQSNVTVSKGEAAQIKLQVPNPRLWWPRGYGNPDLYILRISASIDKRVVHTYESTVGIRTVELLQKTPTGRPTFQFIINGTPIYARGSNLIPVDYLKVHGSEKDYRKVFALLGAEHCNMLRMWGGGFVESDEFFAEANRTGLMIWQDFYLHSNMYPDYDPVWVKNFRDECADILRRIRRHPCLVLIAGGNEQREGWDEWGWKGDPGHFYGEKLIVETIPELLKEMPSGVPYIDNSPHGGSESQSPANGDGHIWGSYYNSYKDPLFVTETCWSLESYSHPETLKEVMHLDVDSDEFSKPGWPAAWKKRTSRDLLIRAPYTGCYDFWTLRRYIRSLELEQGLADHYALANFRLNSPSNNGILYWSFNKGGPLFQFGTVDYKLRPLISHYIVARLFQDVVVGVRRQYNTLHVVASNHSRATVKAHVEVVHVITDGKIVKKWSVDAELPTGPTVRALDIDGLYDAVVDRTKEAAFVRLSVDGAHVSDELLLFAPPVEVSTATAPLKVSTQAIGGGVFELSVSSTAVSKMVSIKADDDILLSDNYFPVIPGYGRTVRLQSIEGKSLKGSKVSISNFDGTDSISVSL